MPVSFQIWLKKGTQNKWNNSCHLFSPYFTHTDSFKSPNDPLGYGTDTLLYRGGTEKLSNLQKVAQPMRAGQYLPPGSLALSHAHDHHILPHTSVGQAPAVSFRLTVLTLQPLHFPSSRTKIPPKVPPYLCHRCWPDSGL